ncbi:MAG TPA: phosphate--acyl-ACP acyltransferase, partial [Syntrophorhabdus aromaticivorans]|nr:phosphate--acyl-ACP acyltransferase [Syntrophorhabdus aromaticivorans]
IVLVGDEARLKSALQDPSGVEIVHAPEYVEMTESPSSALRKKKRSSLNKAFELLRARDVQGVVTAGNSGA